MAELGRELVLTRARAVIRLCLDVKLAMLGEDGGSNNRQILVSTLPMVQWYEDGTVVRGWDGGTVVQHCAFGPSKVISYDDGISYYR